MIFFETVALLLKTSDGIAYISLVTVHGIFIKAGIDQNWLVVFRHPSEKYEFVNWDDDIPNIWENKKCSKPPTSPCLQITGICHHSATIVEIYEVGIKCIGQFTWHGNCRIWGVSYIQKSDTNHILKTTGRGHRLFSLHLP